MGKGDMKTAKGKRVRGSHGNARPRKTSTSSVSAAPKAGKATTKAADKKTAAKKTATKKAATKKTNSESAE